MKDLVNLTIIDRQGIATVHEAPTDMNLNLMEFMKAAEYPVKGTCGGMALCSTCHIYIESDHSLHPMTDDEEAILDQAFFVNAKSRLGCQIHIDESLDGLVFRIAPEDESAG
jgi:ferredoxin-2, mitochondrial